MTVLYILDYGTVGGATRSFVEMVTQMKSLGVHPIVVTSKRNELNDELESKGIRTVVAGHYTLLEQLRIKGIKWPLSLVRNFLRFHFHEKKALRILANEIDFEKIDLIHTNSARNSLGCRLNIKYKIPHLMHIREFADADFNCRPLAPYINLYNEGTTRFICISDAVRKHWIKKGINETKAITVYNGIHYNDINISSDTDKYSDVLKMVIVGGVYPTKGQHYAVEALGKLPNEIKQNVTLDIIGWYSQEYVNKMLTCAEESGIKNNINILGARNDVHQLLGNYHIGLMCSRAEGFGRTTAEYMHARLGVIASDAGANRELITDGVHGLIYTSGDANALSKCIESFYRNRELLVKYSSAAQVKAQNCYTDEINSNNIFNIYKATINNG